MNLNKLKIAIMEDGLGDVAEEILQDWSLEREDIITDFDNIHRIINKRDVDIYEIANYDMGYFFGMEVMDTAQHKLINELKDEYKGIAEGFANNYLDGFELDDEEEKEDKQEYITLITEEIETNTKRENQLWEAGYIRGYEIAMNKVNNILNQK